MTVLYLNSELIGQGDAALGKKLMRSFLNELLFAEIAIDEIVCVNSGVHLTTEGSEVAEILQKFADRGVRISSCGTCLDYYHKRDKLIVGEIGSMDRTVQLLATADRVIQPN